jgi:hypothetical protein
LSPKSGIDFIGDHQDSGGAGRGHAASYLSDRGEIRNPHREGGDGTLIGLDHPEKELAAKSGKLGDQRVSNDLPAARPSAVPGEIRYLRTRMNVATAELMPSTAS